MAENDIALRLTDVCFRYENAEHNSISNVSLEIRRNEFVSILGRNGSGKSTLGKLINALNLPSSGTVEVFGRKAETEDDAYEIRKTCGMVFQDPDNQMVATIVEEDVAFGCENMGLPPEIIRQRVILALETVGMGEYAPAAPHMLSGGQKQRIAIAGVVAMRPDMIVFDESTSMLDPAGRNDIFRLAKKLNASGVTVIWITHFMEEAAQSDRVVVIDKGTKALEGTPKQVYSQKETIKKLGLDVPDMTKLAFMLNERGFKIPTDILTTDEMEVELCRCVLKT